MDKRGGNQISLQNFGEVAYPDQAQEPILARPVKGAMTEWLTEIWAEDELKDVGLRPRRKALFTGPPGTGKTTLAHHLAARLKLPMIIVQSERLIDSFVGATEQNIGRMFDIAREAEPHVIFIDEFDTLGVARRKATQGADDARNAMVNVLLQRMEAYDGFLIAATNRADVLDQAVWRRFDIQIHIGLPTERERALILARYLDPYVLSDDVMALFAVAFREASPALMRQFCESIKRQIVIGPKVGWNMEKVATFNRVLAAVQPHPDLPRPRLWDTAGKDVAVSEMPWPLPLREPGSRKRKAA